MKKQIKKVLILSLGVIFIILGILGLVLPFLQGILFLIIGLFLLSFYFPKIRFFIEKHTIKYPTIFVTVKKVEKFVEKIVGKD